MLEVRAKKALGQHFLTDLSVAERITKSLILKPEGKTPVLEVGPGMGVLTQYLLQNPSLEVFAVEIDGESVSYLQKHYPSLTPNLLYGDFLQMKTFPNGCTIPNEFFLIGNFPYNISSQIFFKVLDWKDRIPQVVGMVQKEVAERLANPAGTKDYGILSVLLQAWYNIEYLFSVPPGAFCPPPKVNSAVIRLTRNERQELGCDANLFKRIVKATFNQRRKTIRNSLKSFIASYSTLNVDEERKRIVATALERVPQELLDNRPEKLSVEDFISLTNYLHKGTGTLCQIFSKGKAFQKQR